jgi:hypothetical protein
MPRRAGAFAPGVSAEIEIPAASRVHHRKAATSVIRIGIAFPFIGTVFLVRIFSPPDRGDEKSRVPAKNTSYIALRQALIPGL